MGIVYYGTYYRWFEVGRTELLRNLGFVYRELESTGYNLPVTQSYCHYLYPARYDDVIIIETQIEYVKRASIKFQSLIWDEGKDNILAEGYTVHAFTNKDGKIVRGPKGLVDEISQLLEK